MSETAKQTRIDIRGVRREQIVEAAIAVIAEQGFQNLSLSEIEKRAGMSRGQLTYYFPAKEDILLAVFDRLLELMYQRFDTPEIAVADVPGRRNLVDHLLEIVVGGPPVSPEFDILHYAFLSQIGHREDFRRRLASLYEQWRESLAERLAQDAGRGGESPKRPSSRTLAAFVQAMLHGLAVQIAVDPDALDRDELITLCREMLSNYFEGGKPQRRKDTHQAAKKTAAANGSGLA